MRRFGIGQGTVAWFVVGSLLLGNACSSDSNVNFDPPPASGDGDGGSAGSKPGGAGNASGAATRGGSSSSGGGSSSGGDSVQGGSSSSAGDGSAGNQAGSSAQGGSGGTANTGGMAGMAGSSAAGAGGNGGMAGMSGTAGMSGMAGASGSGGSGGSGGSSACVSKPEVCDGVDNDCDTHKDPAGTCPEGCTGATLGGHTYYFCGVVASAAAAAQKCDGFGMAMTSINSAAENALVVATQKGSSWLGGSDLLEEDHWLWADGTVFRDEGPISGVYQNWSAGQPNNSGGGEDCLVIVAAGTWNDLACDVTSATFRATCESTGP